jgi:hypothetical protein
MGETPETVSVMKGTQFGAFGCLAEATPKVSLVFHAPGNAQHVADALEVAEQEDRFTYETGRQRTS